MNTTNLYLINLSARPLVKLVVTFMPKVISWEALSSWKVIPTIGRNNPFYHYTGGEDTISFQLDWYATDKARDLATKNAKVVRSWSRANGYLQKPPRIALEFEGLFRNDTFIIESAPFDMSMFVRPNYSFNSGTKEGTADQELKPLQITQQITLKKITSFNEQHPQMQDL